MGICNSTEEVQLGSAHGGLQPCDAVVAEGGVAHSRRPTPAVQVEADEWSPDYGAHAVKLKVKAVHDKMHAHVEAQRAVAASKIIDPVLLAIALRSKRHVLDDDTPKLGMRRLHGAETFLQKEQHILAGQLSMVKQRISKLAEETHSPRSAHSQSHCHSTTTLEEATARQSISLDTDRDRDSTVRATASTAVITVSRKRLADNAVLNAESSSVHSSNESCPPAIAGMEGTSFPSEIAVLC